MQRHDKVYEPDGNDWCRSQLSSTSAFLKRQILPRLVWPQTFFLCGLYCETTVQIKSMSPASRHGAKTSRPKQNIFRVPWFEGQANEFRSLLGGCY